MRYRIVIDTNVVLAALRSRSGASAALLRRWAQQDEFDVCLSAALALEYEEILLRYRADIGPDWNHDRVGRFIAGLCSLAIETPIYFRWRPFLRDPDDDMVVEVAVAGSCQFIISFNTRDFVGVDGLGLQVIQPGIFLRLLDQERGA